MPKWNRVSWTQRGLVIGVAASVLAVATRAVPASLTTSTALGSLLWSAIGVNAVLLLVLGTKALIATRRWFRQGLPLTQLRRQRNAVRRRALLLGLIAYAAHQTLVVLLDPRFSLERLTGRRRAFGPIVPVADRVELAWAFTVLAIGYVILSWLLWRSAGVADLAATHTSVPRPTAVFEGPPPLTVAAPPAQAVEALPRDPLTGRVIRQFDIQS